MTETEKKATERRQAKEQERAMEEQFVTHFATLRESYMKMLIARFHPFATDTTLFKRATRLAEMDFCQRCEDQAEVSKALGYQFKPPALYRKFRPHQLGMAAELKSLKAESEPPGYRGEKESLQ